MTITKRLQDYPYLVRIDMWDMAGEADHDLQPESREACPYCRGTAWRGSSRPEGAYWRGFESLEEATCFRIAAHVRHQLLDNSDKHLNPMFDALDAAEAGADDEPRAVSEATQALYNALPPWERTTDA